MQQVILKLGQSLHHIHEFLLVLIRLGLDLLLQDLSRVLYFMKNKVNRLKKENKNQCRLKTCQAHDRKLKKLEVCKNILGAITYNVWNGHGEANAKKTLNLCLYAVRELVASVRLNGSLVKFEQNLWLVKTNLLVSSQVYWEGIKPYMHLNYVWIVPFVISHF